PTPTNAPPDPRPARSPIWTAGEQLSPQNRVALRQTLKAVNQRNQPITRQARLERRSALEALSAPGADPAEVARRLANARALEQEARSNVEAALAEFAATLPPAERAALAEGLRQVYAAQGRDQTGARPARQ
ncbi:periplasmic heavy metal sensor, partial [Caulobacter sp. 3R27C2-B]